MEQVRDDAVLAAWAPAGMGRIVVVLGQGVVIHKAIVSGKAGAIGIARGVAAGAGSALGGVTGAIVGAASPADLKGSPFIEKVLRNGVDGLLASPRMTLLPWPEITSAAHRTLILGRARMSIHTSTTSYELKFLQTTYTAGDPTAVFTHFLGPRFTHS
jgi:hypothetical protein